jgi:predicted RNase H-like HicB family nuclease
MEEALEMLEDAKQGWFATRLAHHLSIPEPETVP